MCFSTFLILNFDCLYWLLQGYHFGCKLVRGAYMVLERQRAAKLNYPSPILDTIEETHESYDKAVQLMLNEVR